MGEPKKWQQITAADFEEIRELSDTDDEFDISSLTVGSTNYWSQSIVPTKYYTRVLLFNFIFLNIKIVNILEWNWWFSWNKFFIKSST